jgi:hypothetical protein
VAIWRLAQDLTLLIIGSSFAPLQFFANGAAQGRDFCSRNPFGLRALLRLGESHGMNWVLRLTGKPALTLSNYGQLLHKSFYVSMLPVFERGSAYGRALDGR